MMESYESSDSDVRGHEGPIYVKKADDDVAELTKLLVQAAEESGIEINPDYNGEKQEGISVAQVLYFVNILIQVNIKDGVRQSVSNTYILQAENRENLHILTQAQVTKINIENGKATGINFHSLPFSFLREKLGISQTPGPEKSVSCRGEVILSAGAIGSPHLLMLSGIGDKEQLSKVGIDCVVDLPGVGQNLQDHILAFDLYSTKQNLGYNLETANVSLSESDSKISGDSGIAEISVI